MQLACAMRSSKLCLLKIHTFMEPFTTNKIHKAALAEEWIGEEILYTQKNSINY